MSIDPTTGAEAPSANGTPTDRSPETDGIVSVNDRGRRSGVSLAPFFVMGGIALVILIFGLMTVNVVRTKLAPPNTKSQSDTSGVAFSHAFDTQSAPPIPGAATTDTSTKEEPRCADGSPGRDLRGTDGLVVRNAAGQSVLVCPNGQVLRTSAPDAPAQPIPVVRHTGNGAGSGSVAAYGRQGATDGALMLNDGKYVSVPTQEVQTPPGGALTAFQRASGINPVAGEALLSSAPADALQGELTPSATPMVQASRLSDLNLLLPKGRMIDCGLSMRIVSSLAGLATCVVTQNIYSANGRVLLIERGSEAVGEYRSSVARGQTRLFVLWNRVITPGGVVINLQSPAADALGSTGLSGEVDNHWFERIGSAFLLSTIQDGIAYEVSEAQARSGGNTFVLGNTAQAGNQMAQTVLNSTLNIPSTIYKNQGDRAVIYVARDLDFSNVYALRARP